MKELIFPLNAKNPGPQDHEVASEITRVITTAASSLKPRKTPISWFKFEQYITKAAKDKLRKIMCKKECLQIARSFHLSKKDHEAALDHLASFSVIDYYPHLLPVSIHNSYWTRSQSWSSYATSLGIIQIHTRPQRENYKSLKMRVALL